MSLLARRIVPWALLAGALVSAGVNCWVLPRQGTLLTAAADAAQRVLQREVSLGTLNWVSPLGLLGVGPLASLGPVHVGPGPVERSSCTLESVWIHVRPAQSLFHRRLVLGLDVRGSEVDLVQGSNLSWFGFPEDTVPSSRDFLPGLNSGGGDSGASGSEGHKQERRTDQQQHQDDPGNLSKQIDATLHPIKTILGSLLEAPSVWPRAEQMASQLAALVAAQDATPPQELFLYDDDALNKSDTCPLLDGHARNLDDRGPTDASTIGKPSGGTSLGDASAGLSSSWDGPQGYSAPENKNSSRSIPKTSSVSPAEENGTENSQDYRSDQRSPSKQSWRARRHSWNGWGPPAGEADPGHLPASLGMNNVLSQRPLLPERAQDSNVLSARDVSNGTLRGQHPVLAQRSPVRLQHNLEPPVGRVDWRSERGFQAKPRLRKITYPQGWVDRRHRTGRRTESSQLRRRVGMVPKFSDKIKDALETPMIEPANEEEEQETIIGATEHGSGIHNANDPVAEESMQREDAVPDDVKALCIDTDEKISLDAGHADPGSVITPLQEGLRGPDEIQEDANKMLDETHIPPAPHAIAAAPQQQPLIVLGQLRLWDGTLRAHIAGEPVARVLEDVRGRVWIDPGGDGLRMDLRSVVRARSPAGFRWTTLNPRAPTHLRHVTGKRALQRLERERASGRGLRARRGSEEGTQRAQRPATDAALAAGLDVATAELRRARYGSDEPPAAENVSSSLSSSSSSERPGTISPPKSDPTLIPGIPAPPLPPYAMERNRGDLRVRLSLSGLADGGAETLRREGAKKSAALFGRQKDKTEQTLTFAKPADDKNTCKWPALRLSLEGRDLHAPLVERLVELPLDVYAGTANGKLEISADDAVTWATGPRFDGRVRIRSARFHFWDAPDVVRDADLDLVFEGRRLYLHGARALFGAIPIVAAGDLDLVPHTGRLRVSASIGPAELNAARATLGVRPLAMPLAGAVEGMIQVTGPLEKPVFSGSVRLVDGGSVGLDAIKPKTTMRNGDVVMKPGHETVPSPQNDDNKKLHRRMLRRPKPRRTSLLADAEETPALCTLSSSPGAGGAFDRIPLAEAEAVFSLDTATQRLELHAVHAVPLTGGSVHGHGTVRVTPDAESDPAAVQLSIQGSGIDADDLAARFLSTGTTMAFPSEGMELGKAGFQTVIRGSPLGPTVTTDFQLQGLDTSGTLQNRPQTSRFSLRSPYVDVTVRLALVPPDPATLIAAVTQEAATAAAKPVPAGATVALSMRGADLLPFISPDLAARHGLARAQPGAPPRLRLSGDAKLVGRVVKLTDGSDIGALPQAGGGGVKRAGLLTGKSYAGHFGVDSPTSRLAQRDRAAGLEAYPHSASSIRSYDTTSTTANDNGTDASTSSSRLRPADLDGSFPPSSASSLSDHPHTTTLRGIVPSGWAFRGTMDLEALKLNSLKLFRKLTADVELSPEYIRLSGRGSRTDETLEADLHVPSLLRQLSSSQEEMMNGAVDNTSEGDTILEREDDDRSTLGSNNNTTSRPIIQHDDQPSISTHHRPGPSSSSTGRFLLRSGPLVVSGEAEDDGSKLGLKIQSLKLDELEIASLRGDLQEASAALNFATQMGYGKLNVTRPRFSGVHGESLSCSLFWERDMLRLERAALVQTNSKYEVQGEYILPPGAVLPRRAGDLLPASRDRGGRSLNSRPKNEEDSKTALPFFWSNVQRNREGAKWRLQVNVPSADVQEMLPAARVLQSAASLGPSEYERCKAAFLKALRDSTVSVQTEQTGLSKFSDGSADHLAISPAAETRTKATLNESREMLPGLQDVAGQWSGRVQAYGLSMGALRCDFDVKGSGWRWGPWRLDSATAVGGYRSEEGLNLQEFALALGDAKLLVRGSLLGREQDASVVLTDFPIATLHPLFRMIPALRRAVPEVWARSGPGDGPEGGSSRGGLSGPLPPWLESAASGLGSMVARLARSVLPTIGPSAVGPQQATTPSTRDVLRGLIGGPAAAAVDERASPIEGLLYLSGNVAGSARRPTGELAVRLYDGAIGDTRLARAAAEATLNEDTMLRFAVDLAPAERGATTTAALGMQSKPPRAGGSVTVEGSVALNPVDGVRPRADVDVAVRDSGMALITAVLPEVSWEGGSAELLLKVAGPLTGPSVTGTARVNKGLIACPFLKFPLRNVTGAAECRDGVLRFDGVEARSGRSGTIRLRGSLPLYVIDPDSNSTDNETSRALSAEISDLELRVRGTASARLDAMLCALGSVARPRLGGNLQLSHGTISVLPGVAEPGSSGASISSSLPFSSDSARPDAQQTAVVRAFEALVRGKPGRKEGGLSERLDSVIRKEVAVAAGLGTLSSSTPEAALLSGSGGVAQALVQQQRSPQDLGFELENLHVKLGPDLRAVLPVVMNMAVEGELFLDSSEDDASSGPVSIRGQLSLPAGDLNLVATQLSLDREHANRLDFQGDLDPIVDVVLRGGDLKVAVQGPAREWQERLVLQHTGGEALDAAEAARLFETKLKAALLADDGRLALSRLAGSTVSGLMPRIETSGRLAGATWRLVSGPAIPGAAADGAPASVLRSITLGTEVEVQFGRKLRAALTRKPRGNVEIATGWGLTYSLSRQLRVQFNINSAPPYARTLFLEYSSDGATAAGEY